MIDGKATEFIDKLYYEDHYVIYNGDKYFFNGCQTSKDSTGSVINVTLEIYNLSTDKTIFSVTKSSATECVETLEDAPIWNGKTFWEVESQMQWVDE